MEIREILYVKAVSDFKNLTKAAEFLHITQPSLSQSIKNIEKRLGVILFVRTKRGMELTDYGMKFISDASPVITAYNQFMDKAKQYIDDGLSRNIGIFKLSYTTPVNEAIMNFISGNSKDNYTIKVESIEDLERMLSSGQLDLAVIKYTPIHERKKGLIYDVLFKEKLYVFMNKSNPLADRTTVSVKELQGNELITSAPNEYPHKMVVKVLENAGIDLDIHTYTNYSNLSMIFDLVGKGYGISFATEYVCNYFHRDDIRVIPLEEEYIYEVCVVQKHRNEQNDIFIEFIRDYLRNLGLSEKAGK